MRVLQFTTHLNVGGIPTYVYNVTKYLIANGIEVGIASSGGEWEEKFSAIGAKVFNIPIKTKSELSLKVLFASSRLNSIRKTFPFDLVHAHTRVTQVATSIYSAFHGVPYVTTFHGFYKSNKRRWGRRIIKAQGARAIVITPQVGDELVEHFGADKNRVRVILSPIDFDRLKVSDKPMNLDGKPRIGATGRLSPVKGFIYLIEAMPEVLAKYPDAKLYLLGTGPQEAELIQRAVGLNIRDRVIIVKSGTVPDFLNSLDIFCLPSIEEPLGLSVVEAQYFGLPSIVSDAGGLKILVEDKKTGLIVNRADGRQIAQAVDTLMMDDSLRKEIAGNCRSNVLKNFDISKRIGEFISVYKEVVA